MGKSFWAVAVVMGVLNASVLAVNGDLGRQTQPLTNGSEAYPWLIEDYADFRNYTSQAFRWTVGTFARLDCDLDLAGLDLWNSMGSSSTPFAGSLNGNNHVLRHLSEPLFNVIGSGGLVFDLELINIDVKGLDHADQFGGLCSQNSGTVSGCRVSGTVRGGYIDKNIGGLCGYNYGTLKNCSFQGTVTGDRYVGGLCGFAFGLITDCLSNSTVSGISGVGGLCGAGGGIIRKSSSSGHVSGWSSLGGLCGGYFRMYGGGLCSIETSFSTCSVSGSMGAVGGFVGVCGTVIVDCYATGAVTGPQEVGGFCGFQRGYIKNSYSTGAATGTQYVGGFCGYMSAEGYVVDTYSVGAVTGNDHVGGFCGINFGYLQNSYSIGSVTGNSLTGGFLGFGNGAGTCYWDVNTSGIGQAGDVNLGAIGKTTLQMQTQGTFAGWDFSEEDGDPKDWMMLRQGEDYPRLSWQEIFAGDIAGLYGVDLVDFAEIARNWLEACPGECEQADINSSGWVDLGDLSVLMDDWLRR